MMKDLAVKAAREASKILIDNFGKIKNIDIKGIKDLVSNVDIASEKRIIDILTTNCPDHAVLCEESEGININSEYKWIIDPLDGTHNYIYGINVFGVSIALECKGEIILGVIDLPYSQELYYAEKGKGAYLNDEKIEVSHRPFSEALAIYDSTLHTQKELKMGMLSELVEKAFGLRMTGSAVRNLTYIADGTADFIVEFSDKPWDFAAGGLILEEAGGKMTTLEGDDWSPYNQGYIGSNGIFHDEIVEMISKYSKK
ncbi:inositol monophosphatase [Candidatus Poribacteria bacterium]|nr:inositol monophosphatase [Candidatus Poribacteria bacterium]